MKSTAALAENLNSVSGTYIQGFTNAQLQGPMLKCAHARALAHTHTHTHTDARARANGYAVISE